MKKFLKLFLLSFLMLMPGMVVGGGGEPEWYWVRPKPTGNDLTSIKFINNMTGYGCGNNGDVIRTTNGGANWTLLNTPETRTRLLSVDATPGGKVIAVGVNSTVLVSDDFGNTWVQIDFGLPGVYIGGVKLVNENISYFVGYTGSFVFQARIYKSTDGGLTWTHLPSPTAALFSIDFYNENYGIVSGRNATYITSDGGMSWNVQQISYGAFSFGQCVRFIDSLNIGLTLSILSVEQAFVATINGGNSWNRYDIILPTISGSVDHPESHIFLNQSTGYIATRFGRILKSTNGGINWSMQETGTNLQWIDTLSNDQFISCGYGSTILKSTNSGSDWNILLGGYQRLNHLVFVNQSTGFACGNKGTIIRSTDVGETWNNLNSGVTVKLNQLYFINETTGYCVGDTGTFLKTTNAGETWIPQNSGTTSELWSVYFHNEMKGTIGAMGRIITTTDGGSSWHTEMFSEFSRFKSIVFFNETEGIIASGRLHRTTDGGFTWTQVFSANNFEGNVFFIDNQNGFYLGSNRITKTTNSGSNWTQYTNNFDKLPTNIFFGSKYIGLASYGINLVENAMDKTTDGGNIWFNYPTVSANINNWITFTNANTGIAVDGRGCIIKTTNEIMTDIEQVSNFVPESIELFQNYPNPFNPSTKIKFSLPERAHIKITVTDVTGRVVSVIADGHFVEGTHEVTFNASGLPAGVYFYTLYKNNNLIQTKKSILLK